MFFSSIIARALGLFALGNAHPATVSLHRNHVKRSFDCTNPVTGLSKVGCEHMSKIGMNSQGVNSHSNNGLIWIGDDGPNTITFSGNAGVGITLIFWDNPAGDYSSSFMSAKQPQISYTIYDKGSVTISMANGISGGWAGLYNLQTPLTANGQIDNTIGEITTGKYGTVDVSREVNMAGNGMKIVVDSNGCVSDMDTCSFQCKSGNTCFESGTYNLNNCAAGSQPGASYGLYAGNPSGGCQGFSNGGGIAVSFLA